MSRLPNLFIVGAPKSGTTSIYEYLQGHPEAFLPEFKEPSYFAPDLALDRSGNFLRYPEDEELYRALFADAGGAKVVGEGSTRYLYSKAAPGLIHAAQPEARIVVNVRNPVQMIHSLHAHKVAAGTEDLTDFEAALAAETDRHAGNRVPQHSNPRLATYRDRAYFGEQLSRWFAQFGRDRVHVIVFEDLVADTPAVFRELLQFLGIDADYQPPSFGARNEAHRARSKWVRALMLSRPVQFVGWRVLPRILGDARARSLARGISRSRLSRQPYERPKVGSELARRLESDFAADVALLSELLGRDMAALWFGGSRVSPTSP